MVWDMSQSGIPESWNSLHEHTSKSVVELLVYDDNMDIAHFGTGIVLCHEDDYIGIATAISCDPKKGYVVFATFAGRKNTPATVVLTGSILSGLVTYVPNCASQVIKLDDASFYEEDISKSEPLWAVGCFGDSLDEVMPSGSVCALHVVKYVNGSEQETFIHSCPIGDGMIGALIINRYGKVVGMNITRTPESSRINYALKFKELMIELAKLAGKEDFKEPVSTLIKTFSRQLFETFEKSDDSFRAAKIRKMSHGSSSAGTTK